MSSAIKTKKRIINAVIAVLVIALAVTGGAYLIAGSISDASAAEETDISNEADPANAVETGAIKDAPEAAGSDGSEARIMKEIPAPQEVTIDSLTYNPNQTLASILADQLRVESPVAGCWKFKDLQTVPTVDVTKYPATFIPDESDKYETVEGFVTVIVAKASVGEVTFPSGGVLQFGYNLTHVTFKNPGSGDGRFVYENAENIVPDRLGVFDGYYLEFIPNDPVNYESKKQIVAFTVEELRVDFAVTINGTLQPGNTLTLSYKNLPSAANKYLRYQWYRIEPDGNEPPARINGATGATYQVQTGDVGYIIAVVVYLDKGENQPVIFAESAYKETLDNNANPDDNYVGIVGETTEVIKKVRLSFWQTLLDWLYKIISAISNLILGLRK